MKSLSMLGRPSISRILAKLKRRIAYKPPAKSVFRRAAHYFGDHSPIGFWIDQDFARVPQQLKQLRLDGFDTVILVINWPLFHKNLSDEKLDSWLAQRLTDLLIEIRKAKLHVMFRVGFMHQPQWETQSAFERPMSLFYGPTSRHALGRMVRELVSITNQVSSVEGMFFSWEDMWCAMEMMPHQALERRKELAHESEFTDFLRKNKSLAEINDLCGETYERFNQVPIPAWGGKSMSLFVAFFDYVMRETIAAAHVFYPELMPELRVDAIPVARPDAAYDWIHHDHLHDLKCQRATYWGPFYGARNVGETISASDAIKSMRYLLAVADPHAKGDLFVEQFNFFENNLLLAPMHARLGADQWEVFFESAAELLASSFSGYGIWTTRDYRENWFTNAAFQCGFQFWETFQVTPRRAGAEVAIGGEISQAIRPGSKAQTIASAYGTFNIELSLAHEPTHELIVEVTVAGTPVSMMLDGSRMMLRGEFDVSRFDWDARNAVVIRNVGNSAITFSCMYLFGFVQRLGTYDEYGNEGRFLQHIRSMNKKLAAMKAGDSL
jgi:hypothetical protein